MTFELQSKIQNEGLDVILNTPANIDAMGRIMTLPNGGFVPSRTASMDLGPSYAEVVL